MATLVATEGTTPRRAGAKMWVGRDGRLLGAVTIGGCVDARVVEESERVLAGTRSVLLSIALDDADAWDIGLTCGGTVEVCIDPVALAGDDDPVVMAYESVRQRTRCRPPRRGGERAHRLDGAPGRARGRHERGNARAPRRSTRRRASRRWTRSSAGSSRTIAVGAPAIRCFFEVHAPATTLYVFGAGSRRDRRWRRSPARWAGAWCSWMRANGMRRAIASPNVDEIHVGLLGDIAERFVYDRSAIVVLAAHDYKFDLPVLRVVLRRSPAYIGLLGSRRRGRAVLDFLAAEGYSPAELARVHVPIGLDLGAESGAEIALAVAAEALAVRNGRSARFPERLVIATVVLAAGSAKRFGSQKLVAPLGGRAVVRAAVECAVAAVAARGGGDRGRDRCGRARRAGGARRAAGAIRHQRGARDRDGQFARRRDRLTRARPCARRSSCSVINRSCPWKRTPPSWRRTRHAAPRSSRRGTTGCMVTRCCSTRPCSRSCGASEAIEARVK